MSMTYCDEHTCDTCPAAQPGGPCFVPMDIKSPTWQDAVECGCEEEWLEAYNCQNDG